MLPTCLLPCRTLPTALELVLKWFLSCISILLDRMLTFQSSCESKFIGGQYRGTKVPRYRYRSTFLVPVPSVLLWYRYRYRGTLLFFGGTGTLVLFFVGILRT